MTFETFQTLIIIIASISLFVYGLQSFSHEIENFGVEKLQKWVGKVTAIPIGGFLLGGLITAVVQSSTMVSSLTVSLVSSGVLSFKESLLILLGTNVGTTATGWIVTFQSHLLGPVFIVLGTLISMVPTRIATLGKSIFYFGFIFFSLSFISEAMEPLRANPMLIEALSKASNPFLGILYGIIITVIIQSSSVVVGLVIILISQGVITLDSAIPIVVGANVGTTSTALLVSFKLSPLSRLSALSASTFNLVGVLILLPFFNVLERFVQGVTVNPAMQVALAFTVSNAFTSIFFLIFLNPTIRLLQKHKWYKEYQASLEKT